MTLAGGGVTFKTGGDCWAGVPGASSSRELAVDPGSGPGPRPAGASGLSAGPTASRGLSAGASCTTIKSSLEGHDKKMLWQIYGYEEVSTDGLDLFSSLLKASIASAACTGPLIQQP